MLDPIGDIWQAEEAAIAFAEGKFRSLSFGNGTIEDDAGDDDGNEDNKEDNNQNDGSESSAKSDGDSDSDDGHNLMAVVFRNESPATLLLCWVSETGEPHHFYRLGPSSHKKSKTKTELQDVFELFDTDHLENTAAGHAFCLGYVQSEEEIVRVQKSRHLFRRKTTQNGTNGASKSNNGKRRRNENTDNVDDCKGTNAASIVIAGYRPFGKRPSSAFCTTSSSSASALSRKVQLVTISHDSPEERHLRRRPVAEKKTTCFPWCLGGRKRLIQDEIPLDPRGWRVSARWVRTSSKPYDTTNKLYEECTLGGWPCRLEPNWSNGDEILAQKLERDIRAASLLLPTHARAYLQNHCKIWVNRSLSWGPSACPVRGHGCCYHPSKEWLIHNGLSGEKHMCVEINDAPHYRKDCDLWGIGGVMLHELSHAYHHGMLPNGYANKDIQRCYDLAMKEGLYDSIEYHSGCSSDGGAMRRSTAKAYACTNAMEYWAELSAAFLGGLDDKKEYNKWYPFNREQIQKHDPRAYSMLSHLWKVDVNVAGKTTTTTK